MWVSCVLQSAPHIKSAESLTQKIQNLNNKQTCRIAVLVEHAFSTAA